MGQEKISLLFENKKLWFGLVFGLWMIFFASKIPKDQVLVGNSSEFFDY